MTRLASAFRWLLDVDLDVFAAVIGLGLSFSLLPLGVLSGDVLVGGVTLSTGVGCLLYLRTAVTGTGRRQFSRTLPRLAGPWSKGARVLTVLGIAGLVVLATVTGERTTEFMVFAGLVGSLILFRILFEDRAALDPRRILVELVVYAAVVRFAALATTPGVIGVDSWTHITGYSVAVREAHSLSAIAGTKYSMAPFYHLLTVTAGELFDVSMRTATYLTVGSIMPLSAVAVFAAARYVIGARWALLATAMYTLSEDFIMWGVSLIPNSLAIVFFLLVLLMLTRTLYQEASWRDYALLTALGVTVTLTHQVSAFITLILLGTAAAVQMVVPRVRDTAVRARYLPLVFAAHATFTAFVWAITPWGGEPFLSRIIEISLYVLATGLGFGHLGGSSSSGTAAATASLGLAGQVAPYVNHAGLFVFLAVAVVGSLALLSAPPSVGSYTYVGSIVVMMLFTMALPFLGYRFLLPGRWYVFMYALMAVVGAIGIRHIVTQFSPRTVVVVLVVLVLVFPTTMAVAEKSTGENPTFEKQWTKYAYSESELAAIDTVRDLVPPSNRPIYTDHPYFTAFRRKDVDPARYRAAGENRLSYTIPLTESGRSRPTLHTVVYRTYQTEGHPGFRLRTEDGPFTTRRLSREQVCPPTRNQVYTTDDVLVCTRRP